MSVSFVDMLEGESTRPSVPGIKQTLWIAPCYEMTDEPAPDTDYVKLDHGTQDYAFTSDTGKGYFRRIQIRTKSGGFSQEKLGDVGTDGFKLKVIGAVIGSDATTNKFIQNIRNIGLKLLVKDNNNIMREVGRIEQPAYLTVATYDSQQAIGDSPGGVWQLEFECDSIDPAYIYEGTPNITPNS